MITPMRHVTLLCRAEDSGTLLESLRDAGVVHLNLTRKLNHDLERHEEDLKNAEKIIQKLEALPAREIKENKTNECEIFPEVLFNDDEIYKKHDNSLQVPEEFNQLQTADSKSTFLPSGLDQKHQQFSLTVAPKNENCSLSEISKVESNDLTQNDFADQFEDSPAEIIREILCRDQELRDITGVETKLQRELKQWEPFGTIDTATLTALRAGGLHIAFYRAPGSAPVCPPGVTWIPAREGFGLALSTEPLPDLTAEKLSLPVRGPLSLRSRLDRLADMTRRHKLAIARHTAALDALRAHRDELTDLCAYERAHLGMDSEGEIRWITGFAPVSQMDAVQSVAEQAGAALFGREPEEADETPTHLEQNSVVSWIQPVFSFLGVTPGYNEVDVGWSFLLFLTLFSGMIIGDAGYGIILLLLVGGINLFKPATRGKFANLLYCMGGATVIWGLLTGNVFGIASLPAALERLKIPALADPNNPLPIMRVCFLLGAGHLTLAHAWNFWRKRSSLAALADLGWIGSTWTMYFVTGMMVLGEDLPTWIAPLFLVSVVLILLFMTPPAKLKEEWVQHMMLPLSFVNNFVDVVSYVRLYAVGMATFALASSFNTMIFGEGTERGLLATGIMLIILLLGHALNFILAGMGIMVHGIRLNTLEFASHMGLTWSGVPYTPFQRLVKEDPTDPSDQTDSLTSDL